MLEVIYLIYKVYNLGEREIGTKNKIIALACEDGYLRVVALRSRKQV
jgi:hypothetical protein